MIHSILIKNVFTHQNSYFEFDNGLNIISGPNGAGKSLILEMINFSLFGSKALRDEASSYPDIHTELVFTLNNNKYKVVRAKKTVLYSVTEESTEILCTGITATNKFIQEQLTYNKAIYDLVNFSKQHELLSFCNSTEKFLVGFIETVSGIKDSEELISYFKKFKSEKTTENKSLSVLLDKQDNSEDSFEIDEELEGLDGDSLKDFQIASTKLQTELIQYKNYKAALEALKSTEPCNKDINLDIFTQEEFKSKGPLQESLSEALEALQNEVKTLSGTYLLHAPPFVSELNMDDIEAGIEEYDSYLDKLELKKLFDAKKIECPSCNHVFSVLKRLEGFNPEEIIEEPRFTKKEYRQYKTYLKWVEDSKNLYESTGKRIDRLKDEIDNHEYNSVLHDSYKFYLEMEEYKNKIEELKEKYNNLDHDYVNANIDQIESSLEGLLENKNKLETYLNTKKLSEVSQTYSKELSSSIDKNNKDLKLIKTFLRVADKTKKQIQLNTLPNLNYYSSYYMNLMTGGSRKNVSINSEFKITVDDNKLDVLEGSDKVIGNICLKLGVLNSFFKTTFPVFIGDEIDESLDNHKLESVQKALLNLANDGYQIITISHKDYSNLEDINLIKLGAE